LEKKKTLAQCPQHDKDALATPQKKGAQEKLVEQNETWTRKDAAACNLTRS